jgi:hypothetical protein
VSPLETDIQAVHPKLGCEPAQLIAELFGVLWPIGRCGELLADDCRELGVQLGGCLGQRIQWSTECRRIVHDRDQWAGWREPDLSRAQ